MKKRWPLFLVFLCIAGMLAFGAWRKTYSFTATPLVCVDGNTIVNGTDFYSDEINIKKPADMPNVAALTIEFIPENNADTATLDFDFDVCSQDKPGNWSLFREGFTTRLISIPLNTPAAAGTIRVTLPLNVVGISHIRLREIENNSAANDCIGIIVKISL